MSVETLSMKHDFLVVITVTVLTLHFYFYWLASDDDPGNVIPKHYRRVEIKYSKLGELHAH